MARHEVMARAATLAAAAAAAAAFGPPPSGGKPLPVEFTTDATTYLFAAGQKVFAGNSTIYVSSDAVAVRPTLPPPPHCDSFAITEYFYASVAYYIEQGVCRSVPGYNSSAMAVNPFAKLASATPNGTGTVEWYGAGKRPLAKYRYESPGTNATYWIDEQVAGPESRPVAVEYTVTAAGLPGSKAATAHELVNFVGWEPGQIPWDIFILPKECTVPGPRCNAGRTAAESAVNMTFYLAHPLNATGQLANQDAGDLLGDANFLCLYTSPGGSAMDDYDSLSQFTIEVDTRWGVYSLCNGYPGQCLGTEKVAVGRQGSTPCAALGGQCTNNSAYFGSWFSLPEAGQCKPGETVATGQCTWRPIERVKTVALDCLVLDHKFPATCVADGGAPFANATRGFAAIFESEDKSRGGCPALHPGQAMPVL